PLRARHEAPCLVGLGGDVDRLFRVALVGVGEAADEVGDVGGVAVLERSGGAGGDPFPCNPVSMDGRRRGHVDTFLSRAGQLDGDGGAVPPLMSMRPVNRAPSPMTMRGAWMLPSRIPVGRSSTRSSALTLPTTRPAMATVPAATSARTTPGGPTRKGF